MNKQKLTALITYLAAPLWMVGQTGNFSGDRSSQDAFTVIGKVAEDKNGEPLEYVSVALYSSTDSSLVTGTITNSSGEFSIDVRRPGNYYLTADFVGYEKHYNKNVELLPDRQTVDIGEIKIKETIFGIGEVEVIGEKPFVTYQLDRKVIDVSRNPSAQGGTAIDALENVPSVQTDLEGNLTIRGSSNFTVLIDGRQTPLTGNDALSQIPASSIEQIELITNPSVKFDPDGTTGIINIISKKGKLDGHSLVINTSVGNSPQYSTNTNYTYRKNKITFNGGLSFRDVQRDMKRINDNYIYYFSSDNAVADSTLMRFDRSDGGFDMQAYSIRGGIDYEIFTGNVFSIGASFDNFERNRFTQSRIIDSLVAQSFVLNSGRVASYESSGGLNKSYQINVGDKYVFNGNMKHFISADFTYRYSHSSSPEDIYYRSYNIGEYDWNDYNSDSLKKALESGTERSYRIEIDYQMPLGENILFESGYTLRADIEDNVYKQYNSDPDLIWIEEESLRDVADYSRYINAGWATVKGEVYGFSTSAGLRVEHTDRTLETEKDDYRFNYNYLGYYPSLAISRVMGKNDDNTVQFSLSKRINRPWGRQLNAFPGLSNGYTEFIPNPELEPEYAYSYEFNYQKSWQGQNFISIETFHNNTQNKMERTRLWINDTLSRMTIINQGYDKRYGVEFTGNIKPIKWFSVMPTVSYYYYNTTGDNFGEVYNIKSTSWDGRITGNINLKTKTRIQLMGFARGPEIEINEKEEAMFWFSAAVRQEFFDRKLSVVLRADDIFDSRKRSSTTTIDNRVTYSESYRLAPAFTLSLSLRLNQNNDRRSDRNGMESGGEMNSGGDDMDLGF